jgi:hypothetical protein
LSAALLPIFKGSFEPLSAAAAIIIKVLFEPLSTATPPSSRFLRTFARRPAAHF